MSPVSHELYSVGLGVFDWTQPEDFAQVIPQAQIIIHEDYDPNPSRDAGDAGNENDVALIRLATPAMLNDRVQTVPLMTASQEQQFLTPGTMATITGWGDTIPGTGNGSAVLKQVTLPIVSDAACRDAGYPSITSRMFCAGGLPQGGQDTCQGDSGGPLVVQGPSGWVQAGVVSFGSGCAEPGVPGVYARVSSYIDWIDGHISGRPVSSGSGLQTTSDGALTLVNKPLGAAQWAITENEDGSVTGNIFYTDGRDPEFVDCVRLGDDGNPDPAARMIRYSCSLAARCSTAQCPAQGDWQSIGEASLPGSFFLPRSGE